MKKLAVILIILLSSIYAMDISLAHPGRTDKKGGHTCWTNCSKWGLKYGQYHYHRKK